MLSLDELAGDRLSPDKEEDFSLPAITNFHGTVQAAWGVAGIQNWICPPTGMATVTARLFFDDGGRIRPFPRRASYRWKAYEIERRGEGVSSVLRMPAGAPAFMERIRFDREGTYYLVFTGLPRVWRFTEYWNLPPGDVPMLNVRTAERGFVLDDTKTFGKARFFTPGRLEVHRDLESWLDGAPPCEKGRIGVAAVRAARGGEILVQGVQGCGENLPRLGDPAASWESGEKEWEAAWRAAFTPGNDRFSGHLPEFPGELERLYLMSVLTLLQCRRFVPPPTRRSRIATGGQCIWNSGDMTPLSPIYVWGGPEGGMTTLFLWELEFQAPLLARLDPKVLRAQLEAMMRIGLDEHWGVESVTGRGAGMEYGVNPGAFLAATADYVRITGDRDFALANEAFLRSCLRPELSDYGAYENVLECVSTYEHRIASFNALDVKGMRFVAGLFGDEGLAAAADRLAAKVLDLYAGGPFACIMPGGSRRVVRTVLDFVYVGGCMTEDLPKEMKQGMRAFFEKELMTRDWLRALSPRDPDAFTGKLPSFQSFRADHQAAGSYDGWPARAASVLLRFGEFDMVRDWLLRLQDVTREGPFGQAHLVHGDGRARKASFFNGNCYINAAPAFYAAMLLDDYLPALRARAQEGKERRKERRKGKRKEKETKTKRKRGENEE